MPNYRRSGVLGGTYFFTVNLLERRKSLLVDHINELRTSIRKTRNKMPFHIDDWVILSARRSDKERHPTLFVSNVNLSDGAMLIHTT